MLSFTKLLMQAGNLEVRHYNTKEKRIFFSVKKKNDVKNSISNFAVLLAQCMLKYIQNTQP